jgi:hypothetical protein
MAPSMGSVGGIVLVILISFEIIELTSETIKLALLFVILNIVLVPWLIYFLYLRHFCQVSIVNHELIVTKGRKIIRIDINNIAHIFENRWLTIGGKIRPITIKLHSACKFGSSIKFIPLSRDKVLETLKVAMQNSKPKL